MTTTALPGDAERTAIVEDAAELHPIEPVCGDTFPLPELSAELGYPVSYACWLRGPHDEHQAVGRDEHDVDSVVATWRVERVRTDLPAESSPHVAELEASFRRSLDAVAKVQALRDQLAGCGYVVFDVDVITSRLDEALAAFRGDA